MLHSHDMESSRQLSSHNFCASSSSFPAAEQLAGAQSLKEGRVHHVTVSCAKSRCRSHGSFAAHHLVHPFWLPVISTTLFLQRWFHGTVNCSLRSLDRVFGERLGYFYEEPLWAAQMAPQVRLHDSGMERVRRHACACTRTCDVVKSYLVKLTHTFSDFCLFNLQFDTWYHDLWLVLLC